MLGLNHTADWYESIFKFTFSPSSNSLLAIPFDIKKINRWQCFYFLISGWPKILIHELFTKFNGKSIIPLTSEIKPHQKALGHVFSVFESIKLRAPPFLMLFGCCFLLLFSIPNTLILNSFFFRTTFWYFLNFYFVLIN